MTFKLVKNKNLIKRNLNNEYIYLPKDIIISKLKENIILNGVNIDSQKKEINYIDISCVINNKINSYNHIIENFPSRAKRIIKNKDTIVSSVRPNLKCFAYIDEKFDNFVCSTGFVVLSPVAINDKFLYYLFKLNKTTDFLVKNCTGGTYPAFNSSTIGEFEYINFNLNEQKVIADILLKQESVISNIEKLILKTEKMFEYFSENLLSGKILLDINDNIISSKEENIGCNILNGFTTEINKNFNIFKLSDIANTITGNTPPLNDESLWTDEDSGIKWISTPDLRFQKMGYISSHTRMLTNKGIKKARVCPKDTLLISCIATIGEVGLISEDSTFNQQINAILPNKIVNTKYLKYYFLHNKKNFIDYAPSSVVKIINKKLFNEFEIYLPPSRDWQDKIVNFLEKQEFLIENQKKLLEKEKQKFEWLSEKLLSGEYLVVEEQE